MAFTLRRKWLVSRGAISAVFVLWLCASPAAEPNEPDILVADFEGDDYGNWKAAGEAFGPGPAAGTLPGQMPVDGFLGKRLVNSFYKGDKTTGTLTSPPLTIERKRLQFLVGGGGTPGKTCINLLLDGKVVRTATGPNTRPGGTERLEPFQWDVAELIGKQVVIEIVDNATGGWGHVNIDQIVQTNKPLAGTVVGATREFDATKRYLSLPVKNGTRKRVVQILVNGQVERQFDIELADESPDWFAPMDVTTFRGKQITVKVDRLPETSQALKLIEQADELHGAADLYRERLRPQLHFSPRRGWTNDPNGLVYYNGEYHLFFQHNPYGWSWGNMHWGHAVSRDLVHWEELGDVLYPDAMGPMFSGSAVVDWNNTSGLGRDGKPPLVLLYTAAGHPTVQCLAYSTDGRTFTKYAGNPIVKEITGGNRDPKVIWHEPTKRWVMTLYVRVGDARDKDKAAASHTIHFLTSPNLKDWTVTSQISGFHECPDIFELPVDGDAKNRKWVLTAANSDYMVGTFDGEKFTPETPILKGHRGQGFYAAQTFSDIPSRDGRRIQIGWLQAPSPGMPFNQCMSLPLELRLAATPDGPRLTWTPVKELETLRVKKNMEAELAELRAEIEPGTATEIHLTLRGVSIVYDVAKQELVVNGRRAPAPLQNGRLRLAAYIDRTATEIFASDGLTYIPLPFISKGDDRGLTVATVGGQATYHLLSVDELRSTWK